ncbi:MAG: cysteine--tRNA ligase [Candidatus Woykebacteria bacterium RBG_16_44_10]|uniref:Cysteine--tRNA ligase n=1 Tax=Candidatus Woykebacteria bacterium RBG_16_44_10 TaxID=1802597 RepID=A0A1G1WCI9_9BACT|nr:MAG: cysteine--tRNA ligase [Candidatus Woykebacteria bacterium RBG_16_44_10]
MSEIYLTNTLTRKKEKFVPIKEGEVGIYSCGPTVYRDIHIGNFRTYLAADLLKRVLLYNGLSVHHIKNITDVGHMRADEAHHHEAFDPVIAEALKQGKTPQQIAETYTKQFLKDEKRINILPADVFPKATEHIGEMIELIKRLKDKDYAYEVDGTLYFDVKKFKDYGKLSGNILAKMDKLLEAVRVATETDKKDSVDFALWKKAEPDRTLKWDSPWGEGFPGWHIECSAMSMKYLGEQFDIHTGGEDNIFPHHEDEIAQSEAATGKKVVGYWLHGGFLLVDGKKMARREGNVYTISDIVKKGFNPLAFRYLIMTAHYRSRLNFTWKALEAAENALNNLYREITGYAIEGSPKIGCAEYEQRFLDVVSDDLDMPQALAVTSELVRSNYPASAKLATLYKFDKVLGLDFEKVAQKSAEVSVEVRKLVEQREEAREKGDFNKSDELRSQIKKAGYEVDDTKEGPKLKRIMN